MPDRGRERRSKAVLISAATLWASLSVPVLARKRNADEIGLRSTHPACFFIRANYKCETKETKGWKSCCVNGTCRGFCGSGALPANSTTLFIGNSHMREISEAAVCQNIDTLQTVTYITHSETYATQPHTYRYVRGAVRDKDGHPVFGDAREASAYHFANGASIYTVVNHPLMHAPVFLDRGVTHVQGLNNIASSLAFKWKDVTGVVFNEGNGRQWAFKWWCNAEKQDDREPTVCRHLKKEIAAGLGQQTLMIPQEFLNALHAIHFTGGVVMTNHIDREMKTPTASITQTTKHPFRLTYISSEDYTVTPGGLREDVGEHPCLPGPPDDGFNMALWNLYES